MGSHPDITAAKFPRQGSQLDQRVRVYFHFNTAVDAIKGTVVRDDVEDPYRTIIRLDDGRFVLDPECQYGSEPPP